MLSLAMSFCGEQHIVLVTAWVVWGFPWDPLANTLVEYSPVLVLEVLFVDKRWLVGTLSPPLPGDFIKTALI